jgi:hypothetical protein
MSFFSFIFYKIGEQDDGTSPAQGWGIGTSGRWRGKWVGGWLWCVHVWVNAKNIPVEPIPGVRGRWRKNKGVQWRGWIQVWYICKNFWKYHNVPTPSTTTTKKNPSNLTFHNPSRPRQPPFCLYEFDYSKYSYKWTHMVFVLLWLANSLSTNLSSSMLSHVLEFLPF